MPEVDEFLEGEVGLVELGQGDGGGRFEQFLHEILAFIKSLGHVGVDFVEEVDDILGEL